ncbi:MAG TPA: PGF-CTERM sorting domain-containing protein [archaeon]|nr:PGF-CTERM sorting domain-containing protein [archaeon]
MNNRYVSGMVLTLLVIILIISNVEALMSDPKASMNVGMGPMNAYDMMQQGQNLRHEVGMQGMGFMHSGGNMFGHYVTFTVNEATGEISNYSIAGNAVFDSIRVDGLDFGETQVLGSMTKIIDADGNIIMQVHDNPAAVINFVSSDSYTVNFILADGVIATKEDNTVKIVSNEVEVYIVYPDEGSFEVDKSDDIVVDVPEDSLMVVRALPVNMPRLSQMNRLIVQEIAKNRVGAEVYLGMNGSMNMVNYSNHLRIHTEVMNTEMIRLRLNSTDPTGKILSFNLDNTSLQLQERERLHIYYDNISINCIDNPEQVSIATHFACFISQESRSRAQIMINVPEFSEHVVEIVAEEEEEQSETEMPDEPDSSVPGFGSVIALSGLSMAVYLIRRIK